MKRLFETLMAIAIAFAAMSAFKAVSYATERHATSLNYYPETAVIVECDEDSNRVTVRNSIGVLFSFYGIEDYQVGDMVSMIMDDMDTTRTIYDDVIVDIQYAGTAENFVA